MRTKPFTGWHMTSILVAFFGVVIAVNLVMARFAVGTFGGTVVDNSYVASQKFNAWLDAAEQQKKLGWTVSAKLNEERHLFVTTQKVGAPLAGAIITATAHHPLGRTPERVLRFSPLPDGRAVSDAPLPEGRWQIRLSVSRGPDVIRMIETY